MSSLLSDFKKERELLRTKKKPPEPGKTSRGIDQHVPNLQKVPRKRLALDRGENFTYFLVSITGRGSEKSSRDTFFFLQKGKHAH